MTFPIVHSVLDPVALAAAIDERYDLGATCDVELLYRGMNDVYIVRAPAGQFAARVWRTAWRSPDKIAYELAFLAHLAAADIPVAPPVPTRDSSLHFVVQAPEGPRAIALFVWADGVSFARRPDADTAHAIGTAFARMHRAGSGFAAPVRLRTNDPADLVDNLPTLRRLIAGRNEDLDYYPRVAEALVARLRSLDRRDLPFGPTHADFHFTNVHVTEDGRFTLLDFDNSGEDFLMQDVMACVWANEYMNLDRRYADAFMTGYETVRPFTDTERANAPLFRLAKEFRLIAGFSRNVNAIGHAPLRFRPAVLDWFAGSIRRHVAEVGLEIA